MKKSLITLLVVATAGIIVLVVEYHFFRDGSSSTSPDPHESTSANETLSSKPSSVDGSMPQHEKETEVPNRFENNSLAEKLDEMYDTAKSISYDPAARNKALREIVDLALSSKDYAFAIEVTKEISYDPAAKNNALEEIVIHACDDKDFETANRAADEISFDDNLRNQNKKRIMDTMKQNLREQ